MTDPSTFNLNDTGGIAERPQQAIAISIASVIVLVVVTIGIIACSVSLIHGLETDEPKQIDGIGRLELTKFWFRGFCYGGVSGASWVVMMIRRRDVMFAAQAIVALVGAYTIEQFSDHTLARYLANTLGLVVFQTVGFHFYSPIQWRWQRRSRLSQPSQTSDENHRGQFAIIDLIACTVAAATLFTLMQQVELGSVAPFYWIVLVWIWLIMPLVSYCCFSMVRPKTTIGKRVSWFVLGFVAATVITILVSASDYRLNVNWTKLELEDAVSGYARIMGGYMAVLMAFTFAASLGKPVMR